MVATTSIVIVDVRPFVPVGDNPAKIICFDGKSDFHLRRVSNSQYVCLETDEKYLEMPNNTLVIRE